MSKQPGTKHPVAAIAWAIKHPKRPPLWSGMVMTIDGDIVGEVVADRRFSNVLRFKLDGFGLSRDLAVVVRRNPKNPLLAVPLAEAIRCGKPR